MSAEETLAIAETGFDNIARLAELNADEPGWQVEVHRIACECWRQVKDARAALPTESALQRTTPKFPECVQPTARGRSVLRPPTPEGGET